MGKDTLKLEDFQVGRLYKWEGLADKYNKSSWLILEELPTQDSGKIRRFRWFCFAGPILHESMEFALTAKHVSNMILIS